MKEKRLEIGGIPAILWGEPSEKLFLYVHGQGGSKEEAAAFSSIAGGRGWQVLSFDLPEHGGRGKDATSFDPWHAVPELRRIMDYAKASWSKVALFAVSIGAWFSMLCFQNDPLERCLFLSPVLDMERLIQTMMGWAGVTTERLKKERTIPTDFGQTLSWEYLTYAREHAITRWDWPTTILCGEKDHLTERQAVEDFVKRFGCKLCVMEGGEHWFHTPAQLEVLRHWTEEEI